jgi:2-dehydro-3-deoxyglucarate aldolase/4-hydroxy-2-oxoheptanedioate aldolase
VQLETPEAIGRLPQMASVKGVDAVFVGPSDLAASMGHIGEIEHPDVQDLIKEAATMARSIGKPIGIIGQNPEAARTFLSYGFTFVAVSSDIAMMANRASEWRALLGGASAPTSSGAAY